ncbi:SusC/RagA family TonB-linked outer membrane protein [Aquimarina sp. BL5]|uniref:SusC/RagA family TonB-linked outer membrane protein n=1 Tax=Aquimarina sp. BL5 TaxID=1714860 RepID=UPI000E479492|nr:SusC/RagA family TonB-linked outer membrane protein [Aquimarina sp. BL5]AXT53541.1 SusC/RagA family TonB-linked outer membrane protein [Aquimarina sp. BL5]RKN06409.1 SusC/RagA family TonB-linked outer membrane protein [Aquimarina sp. BL5]
MKTFTKSALFLLWLIPMSFFAQSSVSGTVTDAGNGQPIPGVNIIIKGTTNGTSSDFDGNYVLNGVNDGDIVEFSYVGFLPQEFTYSGNERIDVALQEDAAELEQVVVIGYGAARKKDLTGSVSTVTADDFNSGNIVTPENLLNGRVAGLVINTPGDPGANSNIRIRGGGSLNASNDPLIVVDGLPLSNENAKGARSILSTINPNNIKSFTVLKDASATAIYGNRASAGVIIIETIKGSKGLKVDYNFQSGLFTLPKTIDVFSADEYRALIAERRPQDIGLLGNANTDWQEEIYKSVVSTDNNLSVRGSLFDVLPVRLSLGHLNQPGLRLTSEFERSSASLVLNPTLLNGSLKINLNANASWEKNRFAAGQETAAIRFNPTLPVYDPTSPFGGFTEYFTDDGSGNITPLNGTRNPVAALLQRENRSEVQRIYGNFKVSYALPSFPELTGTVNVGFDETDSEEFNELSTESIGSIRLDDGTFVGSRVDETQYRKNTLFDGYLNYKKDLGSFGLDLTGGYSYQKFEVDRFTTNEQRDDNESTIPDFTTDPNLVLLAFFGRANFSINEKYLLTLSYRRDATSRFSEENRWGNFPAAAFAWNISDENFMADSNLFSNLKLRLGYGVTGQQDIGGSKLSFASSVVNGQPTSQYIINGQLVTVTVPTGINPNLTWETATTYNAGLDFGFLNGRINGSIDVFKKETNDLLVDAPVADGSNFTNAIEQNVGDLQTEGIEFSVDAAIIDRKDFSWNINYNVAYLDQEIESLAGADILVGGIDGGTGGNAQVHREGFAPNSFFAFKQVYDANGAPIEGAFVDLNGDNVINNLDRYIYRNPVADVTMGFQSNLNYKGFDFSFNLRASLGNYLYNNVDSAFGQLNLLADGTQIGNLPTSVLDNNFNSTSGNNIVSDIFIENASFLRMDNITIGYTFNKFLGETSSFRLWTGVQNVFVITEYSGLDPEVFDGIDSTIYPRPRTFLMGANVKF